MSDPETIARVARAICAEKCAYYGDPPCWHVGDGLSPDCDEPGCEALAMAAIAVVLKEAANICTRRYMGDNTREDMEARRCADAILALIPTPSEEPPASS